MRTTLNIQLEIYQKLVIAARLNGISNSEMISFLIKKAVSQGLTPGQLGRPVRYQSKRLPGTWKVIHAKFREDDYEYFLDLRKLLKMSVSLILANSVNLILDNGSIKENIDNYYFQNYIIIKDFIDNIVVWKIIWGYPKNLESHIRW